LQRREENKASNIRIIKLEPPLEDEGEAHQVQNHLFIYLHHLLLALFYPQRSDPGITAAIGLIPDI
jgi:hypothetical protein